MITIYYADCSKQLLEHEFYTYVNMLPQHCILKIKRFKKWQDAQRSLFGMLLLKLGLRDFGNLDFLNIRLTEFGRPYINGKIDFNISHSGDYVVCVVSSDCIVGIDIEEIKEIQINSFKNQFHHTEWRKISFEGNKYFWFYYYWTAKEAISKADGRGLNISFKDLMIQKNKALVDAQLWHLKKIDLFKDYVIHLASNIEILKEVRIIEICFNS